MGLRGTCLARLFVRSGPAWHPYRIPRSSSQWDALCESNFTILWLREHSVYQERLVPGITWRSINQAASLYQGPVSSQKLLFRM